MSKKPPAKKGSHGKHKQFDWTGVYPPGRIKSQIQATDGDIGCLPQKSLQLVNACSMLLLKKVVRASSCSGDADADGDAPKKRNSSNKRPPSQEVLLLSAKDIQNGIPNDASLAFLRDTVEETARSETNKLAKSYKKSSIPTRKKKQNTVEQELGVRKECLLLEQAVEAVKKDPPVDPHQVSSIEMDEED